LGGYATLLKELMEIDREERIAKKRFLAANAFSLFTSSPFSFLCYKAKDQILAALLHSRFTL
jgi:hypothetical protein